jgi:YspA, cpYpsA-related SLOG family
MKLIISGSRTIWDKKALEWCLDIVMREVKITEVITGGALGVDTIADKIAKERQLDRTIMFANWEKHAGSAGPRRNLRMAKYGDLLMALWDGKSDGTRNMIVEAEKRNMTTYVFLYDETTKKVVADDGTEFCS